MKVSHFEIMESAELNPGSLRLVAVAENGQKYVVGGQWEDARYLTPIENMGEKLEELES